MPKQANSMRGKWRHKKLVIAEPMTPKLRVYLQIMKLVEIVYQKHYSFLSKHKQDLLSVGIGKAVKMLEKGDFDPERGNMRNYLYAGIRNSMQNHYVKYLKFTRKEIPTEDFTLVQANRPLYDSVYNVDFNFVYQPFTRFEVRCGDLRWWVKNYLDELGWFELINVPSGELPKNNPPKEVENKFKAVIMWYLFDSIID